MVFNYACILDKNGNCRRRLIILIEITNFQRMIRSIYLRFIRCVHRHQCDPLVLFSTKASVRTFKLHVCIHCSNILVQKPNKLTNYKVLNRNCAKNKTDFIEIPSKYNYFFVWTLTSSQLESGLYSSTPAAMRLLSSPKSFW